MDFNLSYLPEGDQMHYFPTDIYKSDTFRDCVYFDVGAFNGDTVEKFMKIHPYFKQIYAFEPDPINFDELHNYYSSLNSDVKEKIELFNVAVGEKDEVLYFKSGGNMESSIVDHSELQVSVISIDEKFKDEIENYKNVFIKLDTEGFEAQVIKGMRRSIEKYQPNLAVSLYHRFNDLWYIPILLNNINSNYDFFLRQHGNDSMDLVLYCRNKA